MLDEFDVPNVEEAVIAYGDPDVLKSWKRVKAQLSGKDVDKAPKERAPYMYRLEES